MAGYELAVEPRIVVINDLDQSIDHFSSFVAGMERTEADIEELDRLFLETLRNVWRDNAARVNGEMETPLSELILTPELAAKKSRRRNR